MKPFPAHLARGFAASLAVALAAHGANIRSAAMIATEQARVADDLRQRGRELDQETGTFTDPTLPSPPGPGGVNGTPSILGVKYQDPGITMDDVRVRGEVFKEVERIRATIAPQVKQQRSHIEKHQAEFRKLNEEVGKILPILNARQKEWDAARDNAYKAGDREAVDARLQAADAKFKPIVDALDSKVKGLYDQMPKHRAEWENAEQAIRNLNQSIAPQIEQAEAPLRRRSR